MFFTRSPLIVRFRLSWRSVTVNLATTNKQRGNEKRDLRSGNLEIWDGAVVNSQTTFLPDDELEHMNSAIALCVITNIITIIIYLL